MRETTYTKTRGVVCPPAWLCCWLQAPGVSQMPRAGTMSVHATDLRVIGLTDDGRLVSFRARSPERTRDIGYVTGFTGPTRRSSGSTSACRTASCTASATVAAFTR